MSDEPPCLKMDFGVVELHASWVLGKCFRNVVLVSGHYNTGRLVGFIELELPRKVESVAQGAAFIAYALRGLEDYISIMQQFAPWLPDAFVASHLLPWERDKERWQAEWDKRPTCLVEREWARFGLTALTKHLPSVTPGTRVCFQFDGSLLVISCQAMKFPMPATGAPWEEIFHVLAEQMAHLPKRLTGDHVEFCVFKGDLRIGRRAFTIVPEVEMQGIIM